MHWLQHASFCCQALTWPCCTLTNLPLTAYKMHWNFHIIFSKNCNISLWVNECKNKPFLRFFFSVHFFRNANIFQNAPFSSLTSQYHLSVFAKNVMSCSVFQFHFIAFKSAATICYISILNVLRQITRFKGGFSFLHTFPYFCNKFCHETKAQQAPFSVLLSSLQLCVNFHVSP